MSKPSWFLGAIVTLIWLVVSLPFTDYSVTSLFDLSSSPPSSTEGLDKLLQDITVAANFSIVSFFILYGLNRKWYLQDTYPKWLRSLNLRVWFQKGFENKAIFVTTNILLALLALVSSTALWFHARLLTRSLKY